MKFTAVFLAIFFFLTGYIPKADYEELVKFPALLVHYQFHTTEEAISFVEFLIEHYSEHAAQDQEHQNLPFHQHDHCTGGILFSIPFFSVSFLAIPLLNNSTYHLPKINSFTTSFFVSIWQPPCIV